MRRLLLSLFLLAALLPTLAPAAQGDIPTYRIASGGIVRTLDPALVEDDLSVNVVNNLFIGLTTVDPVTQKVTKSLATEWKPNADNTVWTFTLRNDVPWVRWDSAAQKATELRKVVAGDVEYAIKRVCDPRTGAQYAVIMSTIVKGCGEVNKTPDKSVTDDVLNKVGVRATDDTHLEITLIGPLTYFLTVTPMSMFRPVPKDVIAQAKNRWTRLETIVTSGAFVLDQYDRNVNRVYVRNPLLPKDMQGPGNLQRVSVIVVKDAGTIYSKYQNNELDVSGIPSAELSKLQADPERSKELSQYSSLGVAYLGFAFDKPPFDNVHVRRAVSAAIDRKGLIDAVSLGIGLPIAHLMPPGIFGAVPVNEVQIGDNGTDTAYAKAELAAGGFPDCKDFPTVKLAVVQGGADTATYIQNTFAKTLGCDPAKIEITELETQTFISTVKATMPTAQRPNFWLSGWAADYPDAHNWMHDLLSCRATNDFKRPCSDIDDQIDAAQLEPDRAKRLTQYRDLETELFTKDGLFPISPLVINVGVSLTKPWVTGPFATDGLYGGSHYDWINIDTARQKAGK